MEKNIETTGRLAFIDVMRGLCMLLVMLGHSLPMNPLNVTILSFHMLAFYFISGYCYKFSNETTWTRLKKKALSLGWLLLTFSILSILINYAYLMIGKGQNVPLWKALIGTFYCDGIIGISLTSGFWFVRELLYISLIYIVLDRLIGKYYTLLVWAIIALAIIIKPLDFYMSNELGRTALGGAFYSLGAIWRKDGGKIEGRVNNKRIYLIVGIALLIATSIIAQYNTPVLLYCCDYGKICLLLITALLGSFSLYGISKYINSSHIIEFIGRNSISYLFIHFYIKEIFIFIVRDTYSEKAWFIVALYVTMISVSTTFCIIINKFFPWVTKVPYLQK